MMLKFQAVGKKVFFLFFLLLFPLFASAADSTKIPISGGTNAKINSTAYTQCLSVLNALVPGTTEYIAHYATDKLICDNMYNNLPTSTDTYNAYKVQSFTPTLRDTSCNPPPTGGPMYSETLEVSHADFATDVSGRGPHVMLGAQRPDLTHFSFLYNSSGITVIFNDLALKNRWPSGIVCPGTYDLYVTCTIHTGGGCTGSYCGLSGKVISDGDRSTGTRILGQQSDRPLTFYPSRNLLANGIVMGNSTGGLDYIPIDDEEMLAPSYRMAEYAYGSFVTLNPMTYDTNVTHSPIRINLTIENGHIHQCTVELYAVKLYTK